MPFIETKLPGLLMFEPVVYNDSRGYFFESYNEKTCQAAGYNLKFIQDNQAQSVYGVIRGLHYQLEPHGQSKFVRVLSGSILDVAVDLRRGSPTYGEHFSLELSAENKRQLLVPKGFAHGYAVLSATAEVFYKCDNFYNKNAEAGINYNDLFLNIDWKIPVASRIISEKDLQQPAFDVAQNNFIYRV